MTYNIINLLIFKTITTINNNDDDDDTTVSIKFAPLSYS